MEVKIADSWKNILQSEFDAPYFKTLTDFVRNEYKTQTIYPPSGLIFNAFDKCPLDKVKVVIIGQDPYHGEGQAMGLSFSVPEGIRIPGSLLNIYKEIGEENLNGYGVNANGGKSNIQFAVFFDNGGSETVNKVFPIVFVGVSLAVPRIF